MDREDIKADLLVDVARSSKLRMSGMIGIRTRPGRHEFAQPIVRDNP